MNVKFMVSRALFKKFLQSIASVEVSNMARCTSKTDELGNLKSKGCRAKNITIYKREILESSVVIHELELAINIAL